MKTHSHIIRQDTRGNSEVLDLTEEFQSAVAGSGVRTGQITAMVVGSTASLSTTEFEPGLVNRDLAAAMERIAPEGGDYLHEETWHDDNGHSHVRATLVGPSIALPVLDGRIPLGTWQQIILMDFDTRPRHRQIILTIIGT